MLTEREDANMSDQVIPDGTYTVMGPGGQLTMDSSFPGVAVLQPEGNPTQQWNVAFDSGTYTLRKRRVRPLPGKRWRPQRVVHGGQGNGAALRLEAVDRLRFR